MTYVTTVIFVILEVTQLFGYEDVLVDFTVQDLQTTHNHVQCMVFKVDHLLHVCFSTAVWDALCLLSNLSSSTASFNSLASIHFLCKLNSYTYRQYQNAASIKMGFCMQLSLVSCLNENAVSQARIKGEWLPQSDLLHNSLTRYSTPTGSFVGWDRWELKHNVFHKLTSHVRAWDENRYRLPCKKK